MWTPSGRSSPSGTRAREVLGQLGRRAAPGRAGALLASSGLDRPGQRETLTPVEVLSAFRRLVRERALDEGVARLAERRMEELVRGCHVIVDVDPVKALAARLLRLHPLRAFDALQLGAALHWVEGHPHGRTLHTLDSRLALAAEREGFVVPS